MESLTGSLERRWNAVSAPTKTAFYSALMVGFFAHATFLTNRLYNHDSLLSRTVGGPSTFALQQGKWFNLPAGLFTHGNIYSPAVILTVGLLILAISAALTVSILKLQSKIWAAVTGAFLVLFPSVMCTNVYLSTSTFFSALLLATAAVYFTTKYRYGLWPGILLLTVSCGTYSVYIGYAAGLFLILEMIALLEGKTSIKEILLTGLKYLFVLALSAVLYYVVLQIALRVAGTTLMNYRGIDEVGHFSLSSLLSVTVEAYRKVYYFFYYGIHLYRSSFHIEPLFRVMNQATILLAAVFSLAIGLKNKIWKSIPRILLTVVLVLLFPLAIHAIAVLGQNASTHWLMIYPFVLVYVYMVFCADRIESSLLEQSAGASLRKATKVTVRLFALAALIVSFLLLRQWFITINQGYEYLRLTNENSYTAGVLLVDDMRETSGYTADTPVLFAGNGAPEAFQYKTGDFAQITSDTGVGYTGLNGAIIDNTRLTYFIRNFVGVSITYADAETGARLSSLPEVKAMPIYPAAGSIALIDGVLIVKLSDITPVPVGG